MHDRLSLHLAARGIKKESFLYIPIGPVLKVLTGARSFHLLTKRMRLGLQYIVVEERPRETGEAVRADDVTDDAAKTLAQTKRLLMKVSLPFRRFRCAATTTTVHHTLPPDDVHTKRRSPYFFSSSLVDRRRLRAVRLLYIRRRRLRRSLLTRVPASRFFFQM